MLWAKEKQCTVPLVACPSPLSSCLLATTPHPTHFTHNCFMQCKARQGQRPGDAKMTCTFPNGIAKYIWYMVVCLTSYAHHHLLYNAEIFLYDNWEHNTLHSPALADTKRKPKWKDRKRKEKNMCSFEFVALNLIMVAYHVCHEGWWKKRNETLVPCVHLSPVVFKLIVVVHDACDGGWWWWGKRNEKKRKEA